MIALGTHQRFSEEAFCRRLDLSMEERQDRYRDVAFFNHEWDNPAALQRGGTKDPHLRGGGKFPRPDFNPDHALPAHQHVLSGLTSRLRKNNSRSSSF